MENEKLFELMTKMYAEMQEGFKKSDKRFDKLESDVGDLKSDVGTLKSDVGDLKSDVGTLKSDVKKMGAKIDGEITPKLEALFDGYKQNTEKLTRIENEVLKHEEVILRRVK